MSLEEKKKTESKEKDKALSLVLGQIERNFGRGSIMRLGDASRMKVETISTGAHLRFSIRRRLSKRKSSRSLRTRKFRKNYINAARDCGSPKEWRSSSICRC